MRHAGEARSRRTDSHFQVQVRVEGVAALADGADDLPACERFSGCQDGRLEQVGVEQVERALLKIHSSRGQPGSGR